MRAEIIDWMGSDLSVANAARVSFSKTSQFMCGCGPTGSVCDGADGCGKVRDHDAHLIRYLSTHNHWSPFAHTAITIRVTAPVSVRTQCFKHTIGFVANEESRRYIKSDPSVFTPLDFRCAPEGSIKQGSGGVHERSASWLDCYQEVVDRCLEVYSAMIADGVAPEQARFVLPQGTEVTWVWTGNLASYARFYKQRTDPHAQLETQELAREIGDLIAPLYPLSWNALTA